MELANILEIVKRIFYFLKFIQEVKTYWTKYNNYANCLKVKRKLINSFSFFLRKSKLYRKKTHK